MLHLILITHEIVIKKKLKLWIEIKFEVNIQVKFEVNIEVRLK